MQSSPAALAETERKSLASSCRPYPPPRLPVDDTGPAIRAPPAPNSYTWRSRIRERPMRVRHPLGAHVCASDATRAPPGSAPRSSHRDDTRGCVCIEISRLYLHTRRSERTRDERESSRSPPLPVARPTRLRRRSAEGERRPWVVACKHASFVSEPKSFRITS